MTRTRDTRTDENQLTAPVGLAHPTAGGVDVPIHTEQSSIDLHGRIQ